MLKEIKELGLEKFAGDEEMADHFVAGFVAHVAMEKEANAQRFETPQRMEFDPKRELADGFVSSVGRSVGGLSVGLGLTGLAGGVRFVTDHFRYNKFLKALEQAINSSHILKSAPKAKVENYGDTIYKFAPNVATDPNLLQSVLANAVLGDGIDIMTIKSLTDLESRWGENSSFSPKAFA